MISAGTDNAARVFDLSSGTSTQVGQHAGPIKCVRWFELGQGGIIATGSWDKTLKVKTHPLFPQNSILSFFFLFCLLYFSQHMVTDAGNTPHLGIN